MLGKSTLRRIGRAPKVLFCYRVEAPIKKLQTPDLYVDDHTKHKVEVLAEGQQFVAFGMHPDTGQLYHWPENSPLDTRADELPLVTQEALATFVAEAEALIRAAGCRTKGERKDAAKEPAAKERSADTARPQKGAILSAIDELNKPSRAELEDALNHLPNDHDYDSWIRIGFAIYHALGDSGRDLWESWSAKSDKNDLALTAKKWPTFAKGRSTTGRTIFWEAMRHGWQRSADGAGGDGQERRATEQQGQRRVIRATPYVLPDPTTIPQRDWLYGTHLIRAFASATFAPGAAGKTSLKLVEAIAMATGRPLLGIRPKRRCRVWYWNGEDPQEEIDRRIGAICIHYRISREELDGWLFVDTGRRMKIVIASYDPRSGNKVAEPVVNELIETIVENKIDVFFVDPFVKSYRVAENDNGAMDMVVTQWVDIAEIANIAIELVHHTKKLGGTEANVESGRGAGSVAAAMRSVEIVNKMLAEEGKKIGIEGFESRHYFSVFDDKPNMTISPEAKTWYRLVPISLGNGPDGGDSIGVATSWKWPDPLAGITGADFDRAAAATRGGNWRKDPQAKAWVGRPIAQALNIDLDSKAGKAKVTQLIKFWLNSGSLVEIEAEDASRQMRKFVRVAGDED